MLLEAAVAVDSWCSPYWPEVAVADTDKMVCEMGCSAKMCLVGEEAAEVAGADTAHTLADSSRWLSSGFPAREAAGVAAGHTDCRLLCRTAHNSHQHSGHKQGRSAAEGAVHMDHKE
jgi:hypothetical protein